MSPSSAFFEFEIDGLSEHLGVLRFQAFEGMSQLYRLEVELVSDTPDLAFDDVLGKPALLTIHSNDETRFLHGIVSRFEETGTGRARTAYTATVVPRLWTLGLRQDCCIFQQMTAPDAIKQVLEEAGLASGDDFSMDLQGDYPEREYIVQYRETDLDFISRVMEEEGIYYWFEHTDSGHKMVISDHTGAYGEIAGDTTVIFREGDDGLQADVEHVEHARYSRAMRPGKVSLRDFNFQKVDLDLEQMTEGNAETALEIYDYPGRYQDTGHGETRASVRVEALRAERDLLMGDSNCRRMFAGAKFTLAEHPRDDVNREYLILRVSHTGRQPQAGGENAGGGDSGEDSKLYENEFEAIPSDVIFRPAMVTPKARIDGPQTAIVTGPSGEEIHCDEFGRVKVHFHWDRVGGLDDKSSCWVRVSQAWSGSGYGGMVIPRVGNEVIVSFLEGDPDQPLITGHVFNGAKTFHYTLPADKTRTSLKTYSSPGGDGFNELRFEDAAGSEEIFLHAQKDWNITVLNDRTQSIGHDHTHTVGNNETMEVKKNRVRKVGVDETIDIGSNDTISVGGNRSTTIGKNEALTVEGSRSGTVQGADSLDVTGNRTTSVGGKHDVSVSGNESISVTGNQTISVSGNKSESVKGSDALSVDADSSTAVKGNAKLEVKGDYKIDVSGKLHIEAGSEISIKVGSAEISMKSNGDITIKGKSVKVEGSSDVVLKGSKVAAN